jgi:hypothetical protein
MAGIHRGATRNFRKAASGKTGKRKSKQNAKISRGQFIRMAGITGGAVAAAGLGLSNVVKAQGGAPWPGDPETDNPSPSNIKKAVWDEEIGFWADSGDAAQWGDTAIMVYPTNDRTPIQTTDGSPDVLRDVLYTQWAVNNVSDAEEAATIVLMSTKPDETPAPFYFGEVFDPSEWNSLSVYEKTYANGAKTRKWPNGVDILGERDIEDTGPKLPDGNPLFPNGAPLTSIVGGSLPINAYGYGDGTVAVPIGPVAVRNIKFIRPFECGVWAGGQVDLEVDSCWVINGKSVDSGLYCVLGHNNGFFRVHNCLVQSDPENSKAITEVGIIYVGYTNNTELPGDLPAPWMCGGDVRIADNIIKGTFATIKPALHTYPDPYYPSHVGIVAGEFTFDANHPALNTKAVITNNQTITEAGILIFNKNGSPPSENPKSGYTEIRGNDVRGAKNYGIGMGMQAFGFVLDNAAVSGNTVLMDGNLSKYKLQSYGLQIFGSDNAFSENNVNYDPVRKMATGTSDFCAYIIGATSSGNIFIGNNHGDLASPPAANSARVVVEGFGNRFKKEKYFGKVEAWELGHGIWLMKPVSHDNIVCNATIVEIPPGKKPKDYLKDQSGGKNIAYQDTCR